MEDVVEEITELKRQIHFLTKSVSVLAFAVMLSSVAVLVSLLAR